MTTTWQRSLLLSRETAEGRNALSTRALDQSATHSEGERGQAYHNGLDLDKGKSIKK